MSYEPRSLNPNIMEKRINDLSKAVGGGGIGNIPIASADTVGGIMIGGSANPITITGSGNASVRKATAELLGVVKAGDGVTVDDNGVISGVPYSTTEHKIDKKWLNGKDIYEIAIELPSVTIGNNVETDCGQFDCEQIIDCNVLTPTSDRAYTSVTAWINNGHLNIRTLSTSITTFVVVLIRYTKED